MRWYVCCKGRRCRHLWLALLWTELVILFESPRPVMLTCQDLLTVYDNFTLLICILSRSTYIYLVSSNIFEHMQHYKYLIRKPLYKVTSFALTWMRFVESFGFISYRLLWRKFSHKLNKTPGYQRDILGAPTLSKKHFQEKH